jgi:hypothetical protein
MKRQKVKSSTIASVGYDVKTKVLEVEFINGDVYTYSNVPKEIYFAFLKSSSKGKYLWKYIRGIYKFNKGV